jgi:hypothetical protein
MGVNHPASPHLGPKSSSVRFADDSFLPVLRIAGMPNYWSNINLRNELPVLENYLFPEIFSNLFDKNVMQNAAAANNRKEYLRRSAVSSCV